MQSVIAISKQKNKWETIKGWLQKLGASMMYPVSLIAFVSLFLGLSIALPQNWFLVNFINTISSTIFLFFPILIYISIIINFHNNLKNNTIINSFVILMAFIGFDYAFVSINITNVYSMIMLSFLFIFIDNKIKNKLFYYLIGIAMTLLLLIPIIFTNLLVYFTGYVISLLPWGLSSFFYGFTNRILNPIGLHSILMSAFLYTDIGGILTIYNDNGQIVQQIGGDSQIWVYMYTNGLDFTTSSGEFIGNDGLNYTYELSNSNDVGQYQQGFLPMISFAFPMLGITYVILRGWENGKNFLFLTLITACTGVTEMTEFYFIFASPALYLINAFFFGISFMLMNILNCSVWISTGWFIDILLFGLIPSLKGFETNWYWIPIIGVSIGLIYSFIFFFIQRKLLKNEQIIIQ